MRWLQFGQRQLAAQVQRLRGLLDSHTEGNEAIRARTTDLEQATKAFISRREELHGRVLQDRERLTEMEERLESSLALLEPMVISLLGLLMGGFAVLMIYPLSKVVQSL